MGQERQQDDAHRQQGEARPQLLPRQPLHPLVQRSLQGEEQGGSDRGGRGRGLVPHHREGAEGERQHGRHHGGGPEGLVVHHLAIAKDGNRRRERGEREAERDHARLSGAERERAPDAAEQPRKGMGAQAGRALSLGLRALLPAALYSDDEADGERDRQPLDELKCIHGSTESRVRTCSGLGGPS